MPATSRYLNFFIYFTYVYSVWLRVICVLWMQVAMEAIKGQGSSEARVTGSVSAGDGTRALCKSSVCCQPLGPSVRAVHAASHSAFSSTPQLTFGITFFLFIKLFTLLIFLLWPLLQPECLIRLRLAACRCLVRQCGGQGSVFDSSSVRFHNFFCFSSIYLFIRQGLPLSLLFWLD